MNPDIYKASLKDIACIQILISKSARKLQVQYYEKPKIEAALDLIKGIEELIVAGNFFVAEYEKKIIGCGGWIADVFEPSKGRNKGLFRTS
ncbi:MAG: hypothetical protein HOO93_13160 [Methyloglobulus sp.]|nr:hypothetical protein [Methyloglobulus sp.]